MTIGPLDLQRATPSTGSFAHWQPLSEKIRRGKRLFSVILGNSIEVQPWAEELCRWLRSLTSGSRCENAAVSGTGSRWQYEHLNQTGRLAREINQTRPDLVFLDTSVGAWRQMAWNKGGDPETFLDTSQEAYYVEMFLRKFLSYDFQPVLVALEWVTFWGVISETPGFLTNEDVHLPVYKYYGVPVCSFRDVLWPHLYGKANPPNLLEDLTASEEPSFDLTDIFVDYMHPTAKGGKIMLDIVTGYLCNMLSIMEAAAPVHHESKLPPVLMTAGAIDRAVHGIEPRDAPVKDDRKQVALAMGFGVAPVYDSLANATSRISDIMLLLSAGGLAAWESLTTAHGPALAAPPGQVMPLHGGGLVRMYAHCHIVLMHFYQLQPEHLSIIVGFPDWARWGKYWVQFFFVLSGFVLYLSEDSNPKIRAEVDRTSAVQLVWKRMAPLYPTFLLGVVIALSSLQGQAEVLAHPARLGTTLLLLQTWMRPYGNVLLNGPSWYLSVLLVYYAFSSHWLRQVQRLRSPAVMLGLLWLASFLLPCAASLLGADQNMQALMDSGLSSFMDFHPASSWHLFLAGMVVARLCCDHTQTLESFAGNKVLACSSLLLLTLLFALVPEPPAPWGMFWDKGPVLLPLFAALLVGLAGGRDVVLSLGVFKNWFVADWLVGAAWCLYILHVPLFFALQERAEVLWGVTSPLQLAGWALGICACVNTFFDLPARRFIKALSSRGERVVRKEPNVS